MCVSQGSQKTSKLSPGNCVSFAMAGRSDGTCGGYARLMSAVKGGTQEIPCGGSVLFA